MLKIKVGDEQITLKELILDIYTLADEYSWSSILQSVILFPITAIVFITIINLAVFILSVIIAVFGVLSIPVFISTLLYKIYRYIIT